MRKQWMMFVAVMTAFVITACGDGDGIVINGTTAAEAGSDQLEEEGQAGQESLERTSGTKIEIVTGETTAAPMTAPESTEGWTEGAQQQTAAPTQAAVPETTRAPQPETTAAKTYKVTDVKKTMYATASVRVRASYSTSSDVLAALANGEKVEVTGQSENGWMRVNYKGNVGYVSKEYLTETAPKSTSTQNSNSTTTSQNTKPTTTTGTGTTPGGTAGPTANNTQGNTTGPTANNTQGNTTGPTANNTQGNTTGPTANNTQGNTTGPTANSGTTGNGGGSVTGSSSVTGSVTALDPSGVTVQTSNGTTYQLSWGNSSPPPLAPGDQVSISYETTSSGERRVTNVSK